MINEIKRIKTAYGVGDTGLHCFIARPVHRPLCSKVKCIDCDVHCYTRKVIGVIHIRLHPNNINKDSGIEIPQPWMLTLNKTQQQEYRAASDLVLNLVRRWIITTVEFLSNHSWAPQHIGDSCSINRSHRLKKTTSMQFKRHDPHLKCPHRKTKYYRGARRA